MAHTSTGMPNDHERRALPIGTRVQEFEILRLHGGGGFGIVYLARDLSLGRRVALKEYMPPMASRIRGASQVIVNYPPDEETFAAGRRRFLNEARLLARFDHPALVKVHRCWEENGTAYMAMVFYDGPTLQKALAEKSVANDERTLRRIVSPLLDALAALHEEQCYHRDISPDNILLTDTGPVLLDFGAARTAAQGGPQNFTVLLKEGYAPLEQYATEGSLSMRQGPWTDAYALAAVLRYAITGRKPAPAVARVANRRDPQEPLVRIASGRYSESFLRAIDAGMAIYAEERPQSIAAFRGLLGCDPIPGPADGSQEDKGPAPPQLAAAHRTVSRQVAYALPPLVLLAAAALYWGTHRQTPAEPSAATHAQASTASSDAAGTTNTTGAEPPQTPEAPHQGEHDEHHPAPVAGAGVPVSPPANKAGQQPPAGGGIPATEPEVESVDPALPESPAPAPGPQASAIERDYTVKQLGKAISVSKARNALAEPIRRRAEVQISFVLNRQGGVSTVTIEQPSGSQFLDKLALRIITAARYPSFPQEAWPDQPTRLFRVILSFP